MRQWHVVALSAHPENTQYTGGRPAPVGSGRLRTKREAEAMAAEWRANAPHLSDVAVQPWKKG